MRIAIMHYHLRPGGITTVIRDQVAALRHRAQCVVLTGEQPPQGLDPDVKALVRVVAGIGYVEAGAPAPDPQAAAEAVKDAMLAAWGEPADVLHVHNPTLNKNPSLLATLRCLQDSGMKLLLHVHDFAEDSRPSAFFPIQEEYPRDCHYAVINSRDRVALLAAGLRSEGVHLMWNVVRPLGDGPANREALEPQQSKPQATSRLLYPVRAIRRKNIGEAILLATLLRGRLAVTLPPRNDSDLARHSRWKRFTRDLGLPVLFDAGLDRDLKALMAETSVAVSTSLNEGFGFALLEPWTSRVPVVGRRISHVCGDFEKAGIAFPWMYESLPVRLEWFDHSAFADRWRQALSAGYRSFGKDLDARSIAAAWSALTDGGEMDFGALDEQAQREVIIELHSSDQARRKALPPALEACQRGFDDADRRVVERNGAAILRSYEIGRYAQLLDEVYEAASTIAVTQAVDRQTLLDAFLAPATFRMLEQR